MTLSREQALVQGRADVAVAVRTLGDLGVAHGLAGVRDSRVQRVADLVSGLGPVSEWDVRLLLAVAVDQLVFGELG